MLYEVKQKWLGLILMLILLLIFMCLSIVYGYTNTSWYSAYQSFVAYDGSNEHIILQSIRVPRALIAAAVGISLGIAGTIMQSLTNNPLASPTILGINGGASFLIVFAVSVLGVSSMQILTWFGFAGAAFAAILVYFLGSVGREGLTPMKLTLAGAAMAALLSSLTQGLLVIDEAALESVLFWLAGSIQGRKLETLIGVLPYLTIAWMMSHFLANSLNILALGEDVAKGLGQKTWLVKIIAGVTVILLAGGAVAVAGPIGFVGIIVPHITRAIVGTDLRWVIPFSGLLGGVLLLLADITARYIIMPQEVPVGVMTAFIGTPFFIYIARRGFHRG
ncbi:iron ABC transporter permease [Bacillus sp. HMF5848]|uniref:FecCD family ABC transporter permease n=1 Tax=Bacillus sp. HMF5848 TaxID=2495421 RepID=UPI000F779B41|nr:iron ABC transporter permease [Bacillus sp. HMF5848]RSK28478.1 iron ABC transporter permease [Bacillus sp. HMF5848]